MDEIRLAIVIQGPSIYVDEIKACWSDFKKDLIFSTWKGSKHFYDDSDNVVFNELPLIPGPANFNYQKKSTYYGLLKAKELGYTHVIKTRSDYLPTNPKEFVKILNFDKLNMLVWHYTTFLWRSFPTLNGYFSDHLIAGPINEMIDLWNIKDNFTCSEIMLTWNYIKKLKNKIKLNFFLKDLNKDNDIIYYKSSGTNIFLFNPSTSPFTGIEVVARYESVFQTFRLNKITGLSEYLLSPEEIDKYLNNNYINFLKYYPHLPMISIVKTSDLDLNLEKIIYPLNKLEIINSIDECRGKYYILSENVKDIDTIIIEYFKKINKIFEENNNCNTPPGNFFEDGYKIGTEFDTSMILIECNKNQ